MTDVVNALRGERQNAMRHRHGRFQPNESHVPVFICANYPSVTMNHRIERKAGGIAGMHEDLLRAIATYCNLAFEAGTTFEITTTYDGDID
ncbi:MAG TPA: hypothetical protein VNT52_07785, partial [Acidimicrobiales bacterium]|nr:hypothetical protein [Acidimicrobiales bacterium]